MNSPPPVVQPSQLGPFSGSSKIQYTFVHQCSLSYEVLNLDFSSGKYSCNVNINMYGQNKHVRSQVLCELNRGNPVYVRIFQSVVSTFPSVQRLP